MGLKFISLVMIMTSHLSLGASLQDSMKTAFEKNPKTQAIDLRLKELSLRTEAAWRAFWPKLSAGYSQDLSRYQYREGGQPASAYNTNSNSLNFALSINLYDGKATYYRARAIEAQEKAQKAEYNSTNALIPNTRGSLAGLVYDVYSGLMRNRMQLNFQNQVSLYLQRLYTQSQTQDERNLVESSMNGLKIDMDNVKFKTISQSRDYAYVVKENVPAELHNYEEAIGSIVIPPTVEEALEIALKRSPEVTVANFELEAVRMSYEAQKASAFSPRVDFSVGYSNDLSKSNLSPSARFKGPSARVSINWSLDAGDLLNHSADAQRLLAAEKDQDVARDELEYKLNSVYPELLNFQRTSLSLDKNLENSEKHFLELLTRIENGEPDKIKDALDLLKQMESNWYSALYAKQSVLTTKFVIQKTIGTLFEQITTLGTRIH